MLEKVNIEDVKVKLHERLKASGWGNKLKTFILSDDFDKILNQLLYEAKDGRRFTPQVKQMFRAFEECPYGELKVVIIGQDPYPYPKVADGIAFSCSNTGKVEASLRYMFKEVEDTVYPQGGYTWDPDLKRWSNQGILILNTALTTTIGKVGQHYSLWQPFLAFLFDILMYQNPGLIYVFMGKVAAGWAESVPENNWKLFCTHPASAAHNNMEKWDSGDIFNKINDLTHKHYKTKITW
jgi:uracil-DNA glycosylase